MEPRSGSEHTFDDGTREVRIFGCEYRVTNQSLEVLLNHYGELLTDITVNKIHNIQSSSRINKALNIDKKVEILNELVTNSLDEVAPFCTVTVRSNHKFGLSDETKLLMKKREEASQVHDKKGE